MAVHHGSKIRRAARTLAKKTSTKKQEKVKSYCGEGLDHSGESVIL